MADLIKVGNNFIEQSKTFDPFVVRVELLVELAEVGDGGEEYADAVAPFVVQIAGVALALAQEVIGDVHGENVLEQFSIVRLQLLGVYALLGRLKTRQPQITCHINMTNETARLTSTHLQLPDEIESRDQLAVSTLNQQRNEHEAQDQGHHNFQINHTRVIAATNDDCG